MSIAGVRVEWSGCSECFDGPCIPGSSAWRHSWIDEEGNPWVGSTAFGRRKDAELALEALARAGCTFQDFLDMPTGDDAEWKWDRTMIEAMQW